MQGEPTQPRGCQLLGLPCKVMSVGRNVPSPPASPSAPWGAGEQRSHSVPKQRWGGCQKHVRDARGCLQVFVGWHLLTMSMAAARLPPPMTAYQRGGGRRAGAGSSGDSRCCVAELGWGSGWAACPEGDMQSIHVQLGKWRSFPDLPASGLGGGSSIWPAGAGPWQRRGQPMQAGPGRAWSFCRKVENPHPVAVDLHITICPPRPTALHGEG